ncbi:hypothetical protein TNCV_2016911 [Trichonephila clavipes]|nr:hypothetical protein TNCV_2016911 [Trichonephila clavipes]
MTYVRAYGRPDLFVTFTCNPTWNEIKELLLVGQSSSNNDITARHLIPSATLRRFINSKASRRSCIIMPPKRRAIGRSTPQARKRRALRASESDEQRALRLENLRVRH